MTAGDPLTTRIREALTSADLVGFGDLLDPDVTWGAPDDPYPTCRDRSQVLTWYQRGRAEGRHAFLHDITRHDDKVLISMSVSTPNSDGDITVADRWQVLTISDERVRDIRGYDNEDEARAAAGLR